MSIKGKGVSRFRLNPGALALLAASPQNQSAMVKRAKEIARATSRRTEMSGYAEDVNAGPRTFTDGQRGARTFTDWPFAHIEEWGSVYRAAQAPMRRAIAGLGLKLIEGER